MSFDELVDDLVERVSNAVVAKLRGSDRGRIGQDKTPLGRRKHIEAVRRRIREEEDAGEAPGTRGAFIVKRRYLLTEAALAEELGRGSRGAGCRVIKAPRRPVPANDDAALEEQLLAQMRAR